MPPSSPPALDFATARQVLFGEGRLDELGRHLPAAARTLLFVHGRSPAAIPPLRALLSDGDREVRELEVRGEPTVELVRAGARLAQGCELVIGLGGGSALDAGKAIAALAANPGDVLDYLEGIGRGQPLAAPPLPYFAIPTTAGTGSEVTRNAVLESPEERVKVSLRSPWMLPHLALVDPVLTYDLPPDVTASSGLDALTQLIEPFVSIRANPLTDALCREGLAHAARSLRRAWSSGADREARAGMALASLFGGMALANAALGAVHGFAGPLGGMLHAPHGALCGLLLAPVMEANLRALEEQQPGHPALERYAEIARILTGDPQASARDGIRQVSELVTDMNIPRLSTYGMKPGDISEAVRKTQKANSFRGNPIVLDEVRLGWILEQAF